MAAALGAQASALVQPALAALAKPIALPGGFHVAPVDVATGVGALYIGAFLLRLLFSALSALCSRRRAPRAYGEWAIVTGGSEGIGLAYATVLAQKGMKVALVSRSTEKLAAASAAITAKVPGATVLALSADLATPAESGVYAKLGSVLAAQGVLGNVGILVNNAGVSYPGAQYFEEVDAGLRARMVHINVTAVTELTALVLPGMKARKSGAIINIASAAGRVPIGNPLYAEYSASKVRGEEWGGGGVGAVEDAHFSVAAAARLRTHAPHADAPPFPLPLLQAYVDFFSRSLHYELAPFGVHVQCQSPYFVATELSGFKKASMTVPFPAAYAAAAVADIGSGASTVPFWAHAAQDWLIQRLPHAILARILVPMHVDLRAKYLRKLERIAKAAAEGGKGEAAGAPAAAPASSRTAKKRE
jgi:17beta-estradiol 17-dehydrogenase / very-long-chain 3-oxoacyl-CoA reductase